MAKNWIQKATRSIKKRGTEGKCTPISNPGCTGRARALALTFKKMARNNKEHGGELPMLEGGGAASTGQAIGSLVGSAANMIVPGLGSILSPVLGMAGAAIGGGIDKQNGLRATYGKATTNTNPYGFELGGMIGGKEDLSYYKGRQHRHGGILVSGNGTPSYNPVAEVEGGETRWKVGNKAFIFSKKLKV